MTTLADYCRSAELSPIPCFTENIPMRLEPFQHQIGDLTHLASHTRVGLWNEPGTGKTLPAQAYGLWLAGQGNKVIYVMPPVLLEQFYGTLCRNFIGVLDAISCEIFAGTPQKRARKMEGWGDTWPTFLLMSPKMFVQYHLTLKTERGYTCVIVDEATCLKTAGKTLNNAVRVFGGNHRQGSNGIVLMTGSPIDTNVEDAYGLISVLNPDRYGSKKMFDRVHCIYAPTEQSQYEKVVGYRNMEVLNTSLFMQGRRVKKVDVSDLPPRLISEINITLSSTHRALYDQMVREMILKVGDRVIDLTEKSAMYQAMQRVLLTPELFTDNPVDNSILETLDTLFESLSGHKVVMYAWYQASIEALQKRYAHLNPAVLNGATLANRREIEKKKFIEDESCRLIIANPRSGGVGVDGFQTVSSHVVFAEICPYVGVVQQSIDRCHRQGQLAESVNVYMMVPMRTIAVKLRNDLVRKDYHQEQAVQDKRTVLYDLKGDEGIQGSLDSMSYEVTTEQHEEEEVYEC
jgi:SNF2 family DNA or RNA helicase